MEGCEPNCPEYPRDENGYWDNRDMCTDDEEEKDKIGNAEPSEVENGRK